MSPRAVSSLPVSPTSVAGGPQNKPIIPNSTNPIRNAGTDVHACRLMCA